MEQNEEGDTEYQELSASAESEAVQEEDFYGYSPKRIASGERRGTRSLWLISYSDFMTILMIFFLAMYGYVVLGKAALAKSQHSKNSTPEFSQMISGLKQDLGEQIKIQDGVNKTTIQLSQDVLFKSGSATLTKVSTRALDDLANSLMLVEGDVVVEGHTDNVPILSKKFKSNWELSAARAFSVIEALSKRGVPESRLAAWGFGENRPVASNGNEEGRAKNRRIEMIVLKKVKV